MSRKASQMIVIVEDDLWLAESYQRLLSGAGYTTTHSSNPATAIDLIDDVKPALIVLDVLLHGTTALALLHELQSHADLAAIPVVLVTNLEDTFALDDVRSYGVVALHDKASMHPAELLASVRRGLIK